MIATPFNAEPLNVRTLPTAWTNEVPVNGEVKLNVATIGGAVGADADVVEEVADV